jgi:hypothetical protein
MRLLFTTAPNLPPTLAPQCEELVKTLQSAGVLVSSPLPEFNRSAFSNTDKERMEQAGAMLMEYVDGVIIEGTEPVPDSSYMVAMGLALQKPILYLTQNRNSVDKNLDTLYQHKPATALLHITEYTPDTLRKVLLNFIAIAERGSGREYPSIKFTLRITPRIERYLHWKTQNTELSKADYLRNVIEGIIERDPQYQKFLDQPEPEKK